jgi:hypothetical protein
MDGGLLICTSSIPFRENSSIDFFQNCHVHLK